MSFVGRRSSLQSGSPSLSERRTVRSGGDGRGPSQEVPRMVVRLLPKADGSGFELEPSNIVLNISRQAYMSRMTTCWPKWILIPEHVRGRASGRTSWNSANMQKNPVTHLGGSKSFQHHREDLERAREAPVSYMDVFAHTDVVRQTDDEGSVAYAWYEDDKAYAAHKRFMQARTYIHEHSGWEQLTTDEEDAIFDSVIDPT